MRFLTGFVIAILVLGAGSLQAQVPPIYQGLVLPTDHEQRSFYPASAASAPNGWWYVTDPVQHRLLAFDEEGTMRWSLEGGLGLLTAPLGIDVDRDGRLYVADSAQQLVQVFSPGGVLERTIVGTEEEPLEAPDAVVVDDSLNVYVADGVRNRILKFDSQGVFVNAWGEPGDGPGQFQGPSDLEISEDGSVFVLETLNSRVQRFSPGGSFMDMWGSYGGGPQQLDFPRGFTLDGQRLIIVDTDNYRVKEFDLQGNLLLSWGGWKGAKGGVFETLVDITLGPGGCLLVLDVRRMYLFCYQVPVEPTAWGTIKKQWLNSGQEH